MLPRNQLGAGGRMGTCSPDPWAWLGVGGGNPPVSNKERMETWKEEAWPSPRTDGRGRAQLSWGVAGLTTAPTVLTSDPGDQGEGREGWALQRRLKGREGRK